MVYFLNNTKILTFSYKKLQLISQKYFVKVNQGGKVVCKAENKVGVEHASFNLRVFVPPSISDNSTSVVNVRKNKI